MSSSRYIQINQYAVLEYEYDATTISVANSNLIRLTKATDNTIQLFSANASVGKTGNVMDRSSLFLSSNKWVHLDIDRGVPYIATDDNLLLENLTDVTSTPFNVVYDRIKVHLLSGYTLDDLDGFIVEIKYPENSKKEITASTFTFLRNDPFVVFNPHPPMFGGAVYDRYVEFQVPSMRFLNDEFYANPSNPSGELAYYLTSNNKGFSQNGLIFISFYEIEKSVTENGQLYFFTNREFDISINQADGYSKLSAVIREGAEGDHFEFFPSWDGGFIADYISDLNSVGGDYAVIHELRAYSQVGFSQIEEDIDTRFQDSGFDEPKNYRPVIKYADTAYAFSIDYTMRLYDKNGNTQIIRRASITSFDPKKYGKHLKRIQLNNNLQPVKVYNKKFDGATFNIPQASNITEVKTVYVPTFYQMNNIAATAATIIIDSNFSVTSEKFLDSNFIYGQGDAILLISPFDNYIKFRLYKTQGRSQVPEPMDLSKEIDIQLVFVDDAGIKRRFSRLKNQREINAEFGDMIFKIPASESVKLLAMTTNNVFYLVAKGDFVTDDAVLDEISLYTGTFRHYSQIDEVIDEFNKIKEDRLLAKAREINAKELQLKSLEDLLNAKSIQLEQQAEEINLENKRIAIQQAGLDERAKFLSEQSLLQSARETEFRLLLKESQEKESESIQQFHQLLLTIQNRIDNLSLDGSDDNDGVIIDDGFVPVPMGDAIRIQNPNAPIQNNREYIIYDPVARQKDMILNPSIKGPVKGIGDVINIVEIPGRYGSDMGVNSRFGVTPQVGLSSNTGNASKTTEQIIQNKLNQLKTKNNKS